MLPGHPGIAEDDVGLQIAAYPLRGARRQAAVRPLRPHHQRWDGTPHKGLIGTHRPASPVRPRRRRSGQP